MSRTLFWYIFKDLLRIFMLTSGALSGIMSFGGLLRPLTENGLSVGQVFTILGDFMPAMTTYSLPVAALFATTMVYGRLGADNEITACRAAGISFLSMTKPAVVLGFITCMFSLFSLCFVVPKSTLHVEHVVYSNLAQLTANRIEKNHRVTFGTNGYTIFADGAEVLPPPADAPKAQMVRLYGPMIVTMEPQDRNNPNKVRKPEEFYLAKTAVAYIEQDEIKGTVEVRAKLQNGTRFERDPRSQPGVQASVGSTEFAPGAVDSPIRENTKFMDIRRLKELLTKPDSSRKIVGLLQQFIETDQQDQFLKRVSNALNGRSATYRFDTGRESYELSLTNRAKPEIVNGRLIVGSEDAGASRDVRFRTLGESGALNATARLARIRALPVTSENRITVEVQLIDALILTGTETEASPRGLYAPQFSVPMSAEIQKIAEQRTAHYYATDSRVLPEQRGRLKRELIRLSNSIQSELHARASFSISCFILVLAGCALGLMFRSGNFLSAFAVSVIPALLSIVLIVTGQHTCENVAQNLGPDFVNPLRVGLALIWSGNAAVLAIGAMLLLKLQRT